MEADKTVEEKLTLTPTESNQDENVPCDLEKTLELSPGQEDTDRSAIICSSSTTQETQNLPSCTENDSETGEKSKESIPTCQSPRSPVTSYLVTSDESSEEMEVLTAERKTSVSKGKFRIPPEVISDARPEITVSEEKYACVDEVLVKNPTIQLTIDASPRTELDYWTFSKNLMSRTVSTTSEDTLPDHGVYVSEDQIAANMKENSSNNSKNERNLRKFLKSTESRNKTLTLEGDEKCRHEALYKKWNSDGAILDTYYSCDINRIENISNSAPPSFVDEPCSDEIINLEDKVVSDDKSSLKVCNKPLSRDFFKVLVPSKVSGKYSKPHPSSNLESLTPSISKLDSAGSKQFPSNSLSRRPSDFNISPHQAFHTFDSGTPSSILRQCHSLPNINHTPKKDPRSSSMHVDSYKLSCSVKALFTGESEERQPTTPESSISIVNINDISKNFMFKSVTDKSSDASKRCSQQQMLDSKCFSENSISNINKNKTCKKLIFVSHCENTNEIQTLQESSNSSLDVSHSISNLKLAESVDSGLTLPLVESPSPPPSSKRKISDPYSYNEDCSGNASKKVRILPEEVSSESTQMTDEELQEKGAVYACSEAVGTETDKGPLIEFPEDLEGCSKSERGSTKRNIMILREVEDITDASSDAKRIKPSD